MLLPHFDQCSLVQLFYYFVDQIAFNHFFFKLSLYFCLPLFTFPCLSFTLSVSLVVLINAVHMFPISWHFQLAHTAKRSKWREKKAFYAFNCIVWSAHTHTDIQMNLKSHPHRKKRRAWYSNILQLNGRHIEWPIYTWTFIVSAHSLWEAHSYSYSMLTIYSTPFTKQLSAYVYQTHNTHLRDENEINFGKCLQTHSAKWVQDGMHVFATVIPAQMRSNKRIEEWIRN